MITPNFTVTLKCIKYSWKSLKSKILWSFLGPTVQGKMVISKKLLFSEVKLIFLMFLKSKRKLDKTEIKNYIRSLCLVIFLCIRMFQLKKNHILVHQIKKMGQKLILLDLLLCTEIWAINLCTFSLILNVIFAHIFITIL